MMGRHVKFLISVFLIVFFMSTFVLIPPAQAARLGTYQNEVQNSVADHMSDQAMDAVVASMMGENMGAVLQNENPGLLLAQNESTPNLESSIFSAEDSENTINNNPTDSDGEANSSANGAESYSSEEVEPVTLLSAQKGSIRDSHNIRVQADLQSLLDANQDPADSDGDGLPDAVEGVLGTSPENADSDLDELDDLYEIENGLDPMNPDSNGDELTDYVEIVDDGEFYPEKDTDGDGEPDVWDDDNDGDGVPDRLDTSPFTATAVSSSFDFSLTTNKKDTYVDFQVRPENIDYLTLNGKTWDWPDDDLQGLMQDADGSSEDVKLQPMLKLTRTQTDSGYMKMPSQEDVEDYGIIVEDENTVYVPLNTVSDGGRDVAFSGRMYLPAGYSANSKIDFKAKLVWIAVGSKEGIADPSVSEEKKVLEFSHDTEGAGLDVGDLDGNGTPDMLIMVIDSPDGENSFRYMIGWDLDSTGTPEMYSNYHDVRGFGWDNDGGGAAICDLDDDGKNEIILAGIDDADGTNEFRYMVGSNIDENGEFQDWSQVYVSDGLAADQNSGAGLDVYDLNGDGKLDLIMMAVNSGDNEDSLTFMIGWTLNSSGEVTGGYTQFTTENILGCSIQGAGLAMTNLDGNGRPEYLISVVDDPDGSNYFNYLIGWNAGTNGTPTSISGRYTAGNALLSSCSGGGLAVYDIDGDNLDDMALLAIGNSSPNIPYILWGMDLSVNNTDIVGSWGTVLNAPFLLAAGSDGVGCDIADIDGNNLPEIFLSAVQLASNSSKNDRILYTIGRDMDENGNVKGWTPVRSYDLGVYAASCGKYISGLRLYDIDENDKLDIVIMGASVAEESTSHVSYFTNHMWYRIGFNVDVNGQPDHWSAINDAPDVEGYRTNYDYGGGVSIGDINENGTPDIVLMQITEGYYNYCIGWDLSTSGEVSSWSENFVEECAESLGADHPHGGDILLADFNGNDTLDILLMQIEMGQDKTSYYYKIGWDLNDDGTPSQDWADSFYNVDMDYTESHGGGVALFDIDNNKSDDLVLATARQWPNTNNDLFAYQIAWDVSGNSNLVLAKYETSFNLTGFSVEEDSEAQAAIFYSSDRDETSSAYVDLRYDFLDSSNSLNNAKNYLADEGVEVKTIEGTYSHSDEAISAINKDFLPEALDELSGGDLPIIIAEQIKSADTNMDDYNTAGTSFTLDMTSFDVSTVNSIRMAWFDTDEDYVIESEDYDDIASSYGYEDEETYELLKLLLVWNIGESRLTRIGDKELIQETLDDEKTEAMGNFKAGAAGLKTLLVMKMYANGMGFVIASTKNAQYATSSIVSAIKSMGKYVDIIKGVKVAPGGIAKVEQLMGKPLTKTQFGKLSTTASFAKALRIGGVVLGSGIAIYSFFQIASSGGWTAASVTLGAVYASMSILYVAVLELISFLPGGVVLSGLLILSDMITGWVTGENWSAMMISWVADAFLPDVHPCVDTDIEMTANEFTVDDNDDNGMDIGDSITIHTEYTVSIEANSHWNMGGVYNSHINPSIYFNSSDKFSTSSSVDKSTSSQYSETIRYDYYDVNAKLTWNSAGINIPVEVVSQAEYSIRMDDSTNTSDTKKRTSKLYYDVMPGSLEDFLAWEVLTKNDADEDGLKDAKENEKGTDPENWDTDGDGLSDCFELNDYTSYPNFANSDTDDLSDRKEYLLGTDPEEYDTDGDGLRDDQELNGFTIPVSFYGTSINVKCCPDPLAEDSDGDGLNDYEEVHTYKTNPCSVDTDGDGINDGDDSGSASTSSVLAGSALYAVFAKDKARYLETDAYLNNAASWTVALWVKPDSERESGCIYSEGPADGQASISMTEDGAVCVATSYEDDSGTVQTSSFTTPDGVLAAGEWQLMLVRFACDDDADTGDVVVEIDGTRYTSEQKLYMQKRSQDTFGALGLDSSSLSSEDNSANEFAGAMDDLYVWYNIPLNVDYRYLLMYSRDYPYYDSTYYQFKVHYDFDRYKTDEDGNKCIGNLKNGTSYAVFHNSCLASAGAAPVFRSTQRGYTSNTFVLPSQTFGKYNTYYKITDYPDHGTLNFTIGSTAERDIITGTYTPDSGYTGDDSFAYCISNNGEDYSAESTVDIEVYYLPVTGLALSCDDQQGSEISTEVEDGKHINALIQPASATNSKVTWVCGDETLLDISSGHDDVHKTSACQVYAKDMDGETTLTATTEEGGYSAVCHITVKPARSIDITEESISLTSGDSVPLEYKVVPVNAFVKWDILDESVATAVYESGEVIITGHHAGETYIYGKVIEDGMDEWTIWDNCKLTVEPYTTGITLSNSSTSITAEQSQTITAEVSPVDARDTSVICESSDNSIATVESVSREGSVNTLKINGIKSGTAVVTVRTSDYAHSATCNVTVTSFRTVQVSPGSLNLTVGESSPLTGTSYSSLLESECQLSWYSSNPSVATVVSDGTKTGAIITGVSVDKNSQTGKTGTAYIFAVTADGAVSLIPCTVTVTNCISEISLDKTDVDLYYDAVDEEGNSLYYDHDAYYGETWNDEISPCTLTATATMVSPMEAANIILQDDIWESSDPLIASVENGVREYVYNDDGFVTSVKYYGIVSGTGSYHTSTNGSTTNRVTIRASSPDGCSFGAECSVQVIPYTTGISIDKTELTISAGGDPGVLTAVVQMSENHTSNDAVWRSEDSSIAAVSETAEGNCLVTGNKAGTVNIIAATPDNNYSVSCSVTVTAGTLIYYTVSFATESGSAVENQSVASGGFATRPVPDPSWEGHTFADWYTNDGYTTPFLFDTTAITGDTTIYAKWIDNSSPVYYTVSFATGSGSAVESQSIASGGFATRPVPDPSWEGHTFAGWCTDDGYTTPFLFDTTAITADTTVYAKWTENSSPVYFMVSFATGSGSAVESQSVESGGFAARPVPDPNWEGHTFTGWYTDDGYTTPFLFDTTAITRDTTVYAKWIENSSPVYFIVNFATGSGSTVESQSVASGGFATRPVPDPSWEGHTFAGWCTDDSFTTPFVFDTTAITADTTVYAKWVENSSPVYYTVSFATGSGSAVESQSVASGGFASRPVPDPNWEGHTFAGWCTDDSFTTSFIFETTAITGDTTVYAKWIENSSPVLQTPTAGSGYVSLSWSAVSGATGYNIYISTTSGSYGAALATVGGSVYSYDATGLLNGTTYYFVVKATNPGGDSEYSNEVSATPNSRVYTVSVAANPPAGGFVSGSGTYNEGASLTVTASANSGYNFINWTENDTQVNTNPSYTFTMGAADRTLVANFSIIHTSGGGGTIVQPVNSTSGADIINPATGGTVSLGSEVSLSIPANALLGSDNVKAIIQKADASPSAPAGFMVIGTVYQFTVNGQDHYNFKDQVTMTFTFDPSGLKPGESPAVYYYDDAQNQWVNIGGIVSGNTITVSVDHFTIFAMMVKQITSPLVEQNTIPAVTLSDISGHWAEANINELIGRGAIGGYPDSTFKPDNTITRAEFATILVKAFKFEQKSGHRFNDTSGHWANDFISTAASNGLVNGYNSSTFGPDDMITREQMALMIVKAAKLKLVNEETKFVDSINISGWANSAVATGVKNGIMKGYIDNSFKPQCNATRAEAVTVIVSALY